MATTGTSVPELESFMRDSDAILPDEECLRERKWWAFLLSSIFTFIVGVLSVVVVRAFVSLFCRRDDDEYSQVRTVRSLKFCFCHTLYVRTDSPPPQAELRRQEEEAKKLRLQGQNPDAGSSDDDFMSEAKDWAGELISGQTGTGRILVSKL